MRADDPHGFGPSLARWGAVADGPAIVTANARLLPVRRGGAAAMLKLALGPEERRGAATLDWWNGVGAARVLARTGRALLMERAEGSGSLSEMARTGRDDEASRILCAVAARLHAPRPAPLPALVPLEDWFRDLWPAARAHHGLLARSAEAARALLADPQEPVVLHGDLHHDNVLDFGPRGWLAIDPKGLWGERGFDHANIFTNPDLADPARLLGRPVATDPGRFRRRLDVVAEAAGLDRRRLLNWVLAWTGLSAAWFGGDGDPAAVDLGVAALAAAALDG